MTRAIERTTDAESLPPAVTSVQPIIDGLTDAAVIVDLELRPLAWNGAYARACGLSAPRMLKHVQRHAPRCCDMLELEICATDCLARKCQSAGRTVRMDEIRAHAPVFDGEMDPRLIVTATPLPDDRGDVVAVLEIYRDVTAEARIQERYKILLDRERRRAEILEEQVKVRTRELEESLEELHGTRAQLVQSEKLSSLGQLIAGIAHEINNPLNFIYGNIDFLQAYIASYRRIIDGAAALVPADSRSTLDKLREDENFEFLNTDLDKLLAAIRSGSERAITIVRDLRAFIHGGSGERGPVNLRRALDTTINLLSHEIKDRIEITRDYGAIPPLYGNESQLSQVFMNLLSNAVQAIEDAGTIDVRFRAVDGGVAIEVEDSGVGIAEEDQLRVFDPFFTTKAVGQGTGLGLSISYSIVDGHGGRLSVTSKPGEGSTFRVWLPVREERRNG